MAHLCSPCLWTVLLQWSLGNSPLLLLACKVVSKVSSPLDFWPHFPVTCHMRILACQLGPVGFCSVKRLYSCVPRLESFHCLPLLKKISLICAPWFYFFILQLRNCVISSLTYWIYLQNFSTCSCLQLKCPKYKLDQVIVSLTVLIFSVCSHSLLPLVKLWAKI